MEVDTCTTSSLLLLCFERKAWFTIMDSRLSLLQICDCVNFLQTANSLDFLKVLSNNTSLACWFCRWKNFSLLQRAKFPSAFCYW